jgi:hypothetical protein
MLDALFYPPQIVNLISNDVRRFDDALPFYNFLVGAPGKHTRQYMCMPVAGVDRRGFVT